MGRFNLDGIQIQYEYKYENQENNFKFKKKLNEFEIIVSTEINKDDLGIEPELDDELAEELISDMITRRTSDLENREILDFKIDKYFEKFIENKFNELNIPAEEFINQIKDKDFSPDLEYGTKIEIEYAHHNNQFRIDYNTLRIWEFLDNMTEELTDYLKKINIEDKTIAELGFEFFNSGINFFNNEYREIIKKSEILYSIDFNLWIENTNIGPTTKPLPNEYFVESNN